MNQAWQSKAKEYKDICNEYTDLNRGFRDIEGSVLKLQNQIMQYLESRNNERNLLIQRLEATQNPYIHNIAATPPPEGLQNTYSNPLLFTPAYTPNQLTPPIPLPPYITSNLTHQPVYPPVYPPANPILPFSNLSLNNPLRPPVPINPPAYNKFY